MSEINPGQHMLDSHEAEGAAAVITHNSMKRAAEAVSRTVEPVNLGTPVSGVRPSSTGKRWWLLAAASAFLLIALGLAGAGVYLVLRKPSTIDQLVILTVPSGAEIKLDSKDYGHSPVKLEQLAIGTYTLTITKEGFETIEQSIPVTESTSLEFKLKLAPPSEAVNLPTEEAIKQYQEQAEQAFARGYYGGLVFTGSARYYADLILDREPNNTFALEMRERVRKAEHQSAQAAIARGDLAQAQEIYNFLMSFYPDDEEAKVAAAKLEGQLALRRGKVGEFVRKAEEALQAGRLIEPSGASAYYYSHQALAIDRQNERARQVRNQVKDGLLSAAEQAYARGEVDEAVKKLEQAAQLFDDKQIRSRLRDIQSARTTEVAKASDPSARRERGLAEYSRGNYQEAIHDLEIAATNSKGTPDVIFALAHSYMNNGQLEQAETLFEKVPRSPVAQYVSSVAARGDIANRRGDTATALERYKEARQLGGSILYTVASLDDKIERIERKQREKAAEPTPLTFPAKHLHGGLGGSCTGTITINATGVRYDGTEHTYTYGVSGVDGRTKKDELIIQFNKSEQRFKVAHGDADRFQETLARYKQTYSPTK